MTHATWQGVISLQSFSPWVMSLCCRYINDSTSGCTLKLNGQSVFRGQWKKKHVMIFHAYLGTFKFTITGMSVTLTSEVYKHRVWNQEVYKCFKKWYNRPRWLHSLACLHYQQSQTKNSLFIIYGLKTEKTYILFSKGLKQITNCKIILLLVL